MGRSTVHYADSDTNNTLKKLHKKLRPAGTPVQRVEYIIELLLLRIFEVKLKQDPDFKQLRNLFKTSNDKLLFSNLYSIANKQLLPTLNEKFFPFYANILSQARKVFKTNLGQKVQDQLVLIEEVFKNSNFTNNVKSGNLQEVLALVGEIDEDRLLKTDLLGDAIESALSETGGTKDMGLHRTPDHIRQFMVALVSPSFTDSIFDPACGTAGFGFDSFGFVTEAVSHDGKWPGPKAHPELVAYFKKYFKEHPSPMPAPTKAREFYRSGIHGIEYLGMIRKMAAINFYIRNLNPQNIEQGDSLALFDPIRDGGTKTVILANPPFGAERDQEAYPNVWEEFSREAETTILFVKLMLDTLTSGGRCAVIVSEGFLTWNQTSARTLRKMLVTENTLRAIISLPQGVFVSKGGVGPKTSILVFEKGGRTEDVWSYKVTNDGYTMGINRRPLEGCQLVEALQMYDKYVRLGKTPPETKHSFSVPVEWILNLDPRVKLRIETEISTDFSERVEKEKTVISVKIDNKHLNGKDVEIERTERLAQHDEIFRIKTRNEIAKRIEVAHLYSFNLPNSRSILSLSQLEEWNSVFKGMKRKNGQTLDSRYFLLKDCPPEKALSALAMLDVQDYLEFDIARQYLMDYPLEEINKYDQLSTLRKIIESGAKYPRFKLNELIEPKYVGLNKEEYSGQFDIIEKISFSDGKIHFREFPETGMNLYIADRGDLITSKINFHQGAVALAPRRLVCSTHYQVYCKKSPDCRTDYLCFVLRSPKFLVQLDEQKNKGIKNEQGPEFIGGFEVPLPPPEIQETIARKCDALKSVALSCKAIQKNSELVFPEFTGSNLTPLREAVLDTKNGWSPVCAGGDTPVLSLSCLKRGQIDQTERKYTSDLRPDLNKFYIHEGDFFYSRGNTAELVALAGIVGPVKENIVFPDLLTRVVFDQTKILPAYAVILFNSTLGRGYFGRVPEGASPTMVKVSKDYMAEFCVPHMGDMETQKTIIDKANRYLDTLAGMDRLKDDAQKQIQQILDGIWG